MKYKKYIFFILIIMVLGCNRIYAYNKNYSKNLSFNQINILAVDCDGLFGDKNNPESLRYLLNEILTYPKIIVPIIVIGLGIVDMAKAVIASKEDEMKKAQKTFIKRVIIGVAFFFVPVFIDIIMGLADMVWNGMYTTCGL